MNDNYTLVLCGQVDHRPPYLNRRFLYITSIWVVFAKNVVLNSITSLRHVYKLMRTHREQSHPSSFNCFYWLLQLGCVEDRAVSFHPALSIYKFISTTRIPNQPEPVDGPYVENSGFCNGASWRLISEKEMLSPCFSFLFAVNLTGLQQRQEQLTAKASRPFITNANL